MLVIQRQMKRDSDNDEKVQCNMRKTKRKERWDYIKFWNCTKQKYKFTDNKIVGHKNQKF